METNLEEKGCIDPHPTTVHTMGASRQDTAQAPPSHTAVALATDAEVTLITTADETSSYMPSEETNSDSSTELVATTTQQAEVLVNTRYADEADFVTREEVRDMVEQAYLRGRNEAVRAQIMADSTLTSDSPAHSGTLAPDIAELFATRPSVWP